MIRGSWQLAGGRIQGFRVTGHAGYAEHGQDVVCAAISALAQTAVIALERLTDCEVTAQIREGHLECTVHGGAPVDSVAWVILESIRLGMEDIAALYPDNVRIEKQEV